MEWLESAEIKAIKINKNYGKKQSKIASILTLVVICFIIVITTQYTTLIYGDKIISYARDFLSIGNFLNVMFLIAIMFCVIAYIWSLIYSIRTIILGKTGIKNKVNTTRTLKKGILYLTISNIAMFIFLILLVVNFFIKH